MQREQKEKGDGLTDEGEETGHFGYTLERKWRNLVTSEEQEEKELHKYAAATF